MIKQYCDHCETEILDGVTEGLSEDDVYAIEGQDSYHFHISAVGLLLCRDCFDSLLVNALDLEMVQPHVEEKAEEPEPEPEPKPSKPGSFMGQLSPGGQWSWSGSGRPSDDWHFIIAKEV